MGPYLGCFGEQGLGFIRLRASLGGSVVKKPPAKQETRVQSLGREDPLEKEMATHSSVLAWRIPWTEELGALQSMGSKKLDTTEQLNTTNNHETRQV